MSSFASGAGNRFGVLDVNISDPSEISKAKIAKVKNEARNPPQNKLRSDTGNQKASLYAKNAKNEGKRSVKSDVKNHPQKDQNETSLPANEDVQTSDRPQKDTSNTSNYTHPNRKRGRGNAATNSMPRDIKTTETVVVTDRKRGGDSQRVPSNAGRRDVDPENSRFTQNTYSSPPDLDEEVPGPSRYEGGRGRYSRGAHNYRRGEFSGRRGRTFDRHSGSVTGSTAYNKREFRGPDSALLRENDIHKGGMDMLETSERLDNSRINGDDSAMDISETPLATNKPHSGYESRRMEEDSTGGTGSYRDGGAGHRGRYRRGTRGYRQGGNDRSRLENKYRVHHPPSTSTDASTRVQTERTEVNLDLEKDFPALSI